MFGSISRSTLALMAALSAGLGAAPVVMTQPALIQSAPRVTRSSKRSLFGGAARSAGLFGRRGAGISMAQQKRTATKKRGIARNRRNHS